MTSLEDPSIMVFVRLELLEDCMESAPIARSPVAARFRIFARSAMSREKLVSSKGGGSDLVWLIAVAITEAAELFWFAVAMASLYALYAGRG